MKVVCKSKRNTKSYQKPNEDRFLCDRTNNIYIVLDGISRDKINGKYPMPSPSAIVTEKAIIAAHEYILNYMSKYTNYCQLLYDAMIEANDKINDYNLKNLDEFAPGTVGIITLFLNNNLYYAFIGDCYGVVVSDMQKKIFTRCQTEKILKHKREFTFKEIRNQICNNIKHPFSYGALNGDNRAGDFIETGNLTVPERTRILLYTDGLEEYLSKLSIEHLKHISLLEIFNEENIKQEDDDKTIIIIDT